MTRLERVLAVVGILATAGAIGLWRAGQGLARDESARASRQLARGSNESSASRRSPNLALRMQGTATRAKAPMKPFRIVRRPTDATFDRLGNDVLGFIVSGEGPLHERLYPVLEELRALLHRHPNESEEAYRERIKEFIQEDLAEPRRRMDERRDSAERKADVTAEQRAQIDAVLEDSYAEVMTATTSLLGAEGIDMFEPSWTDGMDYAGSFGAVLKGTTERLGEVLTADQMAILSREGWDWGEYLGTHVPWERLPFRPPSDK